MEYIQLVFQAVKPMTKFGYVKLACAGSLGMAAVMYYPYKLFQWHHTEKYRLSVCWDHYQYFVKESILNTDNLRNKANQYYACLENANQGKEITPLSKD